MDHCRRGCDWRTITNVGNRRKILQSRTWVRVALHSYIHCHQHIVNHEAFLKNDNSCCWKCLCLPILGLRILHTMTISMLFKMYPKKMRKSPCLAVYGQKRPYQCFSRCIPTKWEKVLVLQCAVRSHYNKLNKAKVVGSANDTQLDEVSQSEKYICNLICF